MDLGKAILRIGHIQSCRTRRNLPRFSLQSLTNKPDQIPSWSMDMSSSIGWEARPFKCIGKRSTWFQYCSLAASSVTDGINDIVAPFYYARLTGIETRL